MNEPVYRVKRWLFGPPAWMQQPVREALADMKAVIAEIDGPLVERVLPSGRRIHVVQLPENLSDEVAFRRYARRSGEVIRPS